ncbi:MAG: hypothetical protein HFJ18_02485 [Clostridia bacterium]|nr:hypothetical protein [Clostridia bacterium]
MEKKLKIALIILVMVLVTVVGFGGIYIKRLVSYNNILPDYELGLSLKGSRITTLKVADHTHEVIRDSEGNIVEEIPEGADENSYTKEQVPENSEESKTKENYQKAEKIIRGRLKSSKISNYDVRLNDENGDIYVELADTDNTDTNISHLLASGKFEIVDTNDKTVLMTNADIESANVLYNSTESGVNVYLDIKFNKEGKKKIKQISKDYIAVEENKEEETEESTTEKTVTIKVNDEEFLSTHFDAEISELTITMGSASTDSDSISENVEQAQYYATLLSNGEMPLEYEVETSDYIQSIYANKVFQYILLGLMALIVLISIVYIIIRYKKLGLLSAIVYIGSISLLLIIIRYTKTEVGLETVIPSLILILINTYVNCKSLKNLDKEDSKEDRKGKIYKSYLKVIDLLIITLIPSVIFTYNSSSAISSIGTLLFWGIIVITLMNVLFTRTLLIEEAKK